MEKQTKEEQKDALLSMHDKAIEQGKYAKAKKYLIAIDKLYQIEL